MVAPMTSNFVQTYKARIDRIDWKSSTPFSQTWRARAASVRTRDKRRTYRTTRSIDFRYVGQGFEVSVDAASAPILAGIRSRDLEP